MTKIGSTYVTVPVEPTDGDILLYDPSTDRYELSLDYIESSTSPTEFTEPVTFLNGVRFGNGAYFKELRVGTVPFPPIPTNSTVTTSFTFEPAFDSVPLVMGTVKDPSSNFTSGTEVLFTQVTENGFSAEIRNYRTSLPCQSTEHVVSWIAWTMV